MSVTPAEMPPTVSFLSTIPPESAGDSIEGVGGSIVSVDALESVADTLSTLGGVADTNDTVGGNSDIFNSVAKMIGRFANTFEEACHICYASRDVSNSRRQLSKCCRHFQEVSPIRYCRRQLPPTTVSNMSANVPELSPDWSTNATPPK